MSFLVPRNDDECDDGFTSLRGGTTKQSLSVRDCFGTIAHREIIMSSSVPRNDEESNTGLRHCEKARRSSLR